MSLLDSKAEAVREAEAAHEWETAAGGRRSEKILVGGWTNANNKERLEITAIVDGATAEEQQRFEVLQAWAPIPREELWGAYGRHVFGVR